MAKTAEFYDDNDNNSKSSKGNAQLKSDHPTQQANGTTATTKGTESKGADEKAPLHPNSSDDSNASPSAGGSSISDFVAQLPPAPPLLVHIAVPFLLIAATFVGLFNCAVAFGLYFVFRAVASDFGRSALYTLPRDFKGTFLFFQLKWLLWRAFRSGAPIHAHFLRTVRRHPNKQCVVEVESGRSLTFAQFNAHANAYAHLFSKSLNFGEGDVLALYMENGINFFAAWLGLSKLGIVTAWINNNLKGDPLGHSIRVADCKAILTTPTLLPVIRRAIAQGHLDANLPLFLVSSTLPPEGSSDIGTRVVVAELAPPATATEAENGETTEPAVRQEHVLEDTAEEPKKPKGLTIQSILCYIYTSGTTGAPKAAIIRHYRYYLMSIGCGNAFGIVPSDRLYLTLPMYHSAGGILGTSQIIFKGCTACIRTKFSASNFWKDCIRFECTVSQYIGEICRYLLAQPPSPIDRKHPIRVKFLSSINKTFLSFWLLTGNGLRPQIWRAFVQRFGIAKIGEFYGSTEGNSNLLNLDNRPGSCGFIPIYNSLHGFFPLLLLKVDPKTGQLMRDNRGFCIKSVPGEAGELVGAIRNDPLLRFEGYVNEGDTQKKLIRNCQSAGDQVFSTGDVLHWDHLGYLYFKDRCGDTYRWRGENVSTTEVEGVLQPLVAILDATVYGVEVPGREGRAGMIALTLVEGTDVEAFIDQLSARLVDQLALYAVPVFMRICDQVDRTGTFKLKKTVLQQEGYDLKRCAVGNRLFYWEAGRKRYEPLTAEMQSRIDDGTYSKI
ncbi:hypothetical protein niasHT_022512 [Heterodera trifolii]|uniref:long-chain-fatty-acid--CoA ligase n=1 Tax=Heterodera trifolii TaxID=157864 RepID=A0ABD2JGX5_9BILA